jgi:hypothetical protein
MPQNQHAINANVFCVLFASLKEVRGFSTLKSTRYVWGWAALNIKSRGECFT